MAYIVTRERTDLLGPCLPCLPDLLGQTCSCLLIRIRSDIFLHLCILEALAHWVVPSVASWACPTTIPRREASSTASLLPARSIRVSTQAYAAEA